MSGVRRGNYSKTRMFVIKDSPVCLTLDNFSEKCTNENVASQKND